MILETVQTLLQEALPQACPVALVQALFFRILRHGLLGRALTMKKEIKCSLMKKPAKAGC